MLARLYRGARRRAKTLRNVLLAPEPAYRLYLKLRHGAGKPSDRPTAPWENAVLKTRREVESAVAQARRLGLPLHPCAAKNWDGLAALAAILARTRPDARVLDAGSELFSVILPWLYLYGYRNLIGIDLVHRRPIRRGPIRYEHGDLTETGFAAASFDAVACLSVIEHGVEPRKYWAEMSRILKPGGVLVTSTDFWQVPLSARQRHNGDLPVHIFTPPELSAILQMACEYGLRLTGPLDLTCGEKAVRWDPYDLDYTFAVFTLEKRTP